MPYTKKSWIRSCLACLLLLIPTLCSAETEEPAAPPQPELPGPIWQALLHGGGGTFILRADLQQVLGLPELALILEEQKDLEGTTRLPIIGSPVAAMSALEPVSSSVSDLWTIDGRSTLFAQSTLSRDEIIASYQSYGWVLIDRTNGLQHLQQPLDEVDEASIRESLEEYRQSQEYEEQRLADLRASAEAGDEEARQLLEFETSIEPEPSATLQEMELQIRSGHEERKWKVVPGEKGWISLNGPRSEPATFSLLQPSEAELVDFRDFPFGSFLEENPEDLFLIAMVFPNRENDNLDSEIELDGEQDHHRARLEHALHELQEEYMALKGNRGNDILDRIGNMLLKINEIDGGIDLDLIAKIPGDPRDSFTAEAVQMGLGFLRMSVVSNSPELARELLDTTVSVSSDQIQARANISHATLMDLLHTNAAKQRRLREIMERMEEVQEELAAIQQADG